MRTAVVFFALIGLLNHHNLSCIIQIDFASKPVYGYNFPSRAKEVLPVSSETTRTRASLTFVKPKAAR